MRLNKYISLAALAVAFTSCQEDTLVQDPQQGKIYTLSAKMDGGAAMSRAQIQLGNSDADAGEIFFWNEGDSFTLYQGDNDSYTEHVFTIKDYSEEGEGDKKTASFVTNSPVSPGEVIGVYPSGMPMDYDQEIMKVGMDFQTELDFGQGTVEEVWKDYFRNNLVMKTKATLTEGGSNTLQFEHLTSLARITYHNQSGQDQNVTEIVLGGNQFFGFSKTVWFKYDIIGGNSSNGYRINYKNLTVKAGESFDFYILFGPNDFREGDMHIHIHTAQTDINRSPLALPTSTIAAANNGAKGFEAGKRYWFNVTEKPEGLAWTNNANIGNLITIQNAELSTALQAVWGAENVKLDDNGYAVMTKEFAESVTELYIESNTYTIHSMVGIEYFTNLETLNCQLSGVEKCDLSKNTKLKDLMMGGNNLTSLDCSNNTELTALMLENNKNLESLNINGCANLKYLILSNTKLNTITVPNPGNIFQLNYSQTSLKLDLSVFTGLSVLSCYGNGLTSINLTSDTKAKLTSLDCYSNNIESLDLKEYRNLSSLKCYQNLIESLDITPLTNLQKLECGNQQNGIVLQLKLTDDQKTQWESTWGTNGNNGNVRLTSDDSTVKPGSNNASGSNFGFKEF